MSRHPSSSVLSRILALLWTAAYAVLLVGLVLMAVMTPSGL